MSSKAMSLKGRIKNYAKSNNINAQVVLQNYMFERFLNRLSVSEYKAKFVVKGGMLIAAIVGIDTNMMRALCRKHYRPLQNIVEVQNKLQMLKAF